MLCSTTHALSGTLTETRLDLLYTLFCLEVSIKNPSGLYVRGLLTFDFVESSVSSVQAISPTDGFPLNSPHESVNLLVNTLSLACVKHTHALRVEPLFTADSTKSK